MIQIESIHIQEFRGIRGLTLTMKRSHRSPLRLRRVSPQSPREVRAEAGERSDLIGLYQTVFRVACPRAFIPWRSWNENARKPVGEIVGTLDEKQQ